MKGKQYDKLPKSKVPHAMDTFYVSTKYDGNYVQIHLSEAGIVDFYTSGNKRFFLSKVAEEFKHTFRDVAKPLVLEAEYIYACRGKMGDRVNSARLTTYRTLFASFTEVKGTNMDVFKVFNIASEDYFEDRLEVLRTCKSGSSVHIVEHELMTYEEAHKQAKLVTQDGWEGVMLQAPYISYLPGKRVNTTIKIKYRPELIARVIEEQEGEGRLLGSIGALLCATAEGKEFSVGSGLDDNARAQWGSFEGEHIEVEYEQLSADGIPLQPVFKKIVA